MADYTKKKLAPEQVAEIQKKVTLSDRCVEAGYYAMVSGLAAPVKKPSEKTHGLHDTK